MNEKNNSDEILIDINCGNIIYTTNSIDCENDTAYDTDDDAYNDICIDKNQCVININNDNIENINYDNNLHVVNILQSDEYDIESEYNSNIHEHNLNFTKILKLFIFVMIMFLCILLFYAFG